MWCGKPPDYRFGNFWKLLPRFLRLFGTLSAKLATSQLFEKQGEQFFQTFRLKF
jgi:hypothetical protein